MNKLRVVDLFCGAGGFSFGFHKEGFDIIFANDNWKSAVKTYKYNFPNVPFYEDDISTLNKEKIKEFNLKSADIVIGGPPCQGFSSCGTRKACDERNYLIMEFARVVSIIKPKLFIMENVKGLLSMKTTKKTLFTDELIKALKDSYNIDIHLLKAHFYGVPQKRERVFIIGVRKDINKDFKMPKPIFDGEDNPFISVKEALFDLPNKSSVNGELEYPKELNRYTKIIRDNAKYIFNHELPTHNNEVLRRMELIPQGGNWRDIPPEIRPGGNHSNLYRRLEEDKPSITIKHPIKSMIIHPIYNRCLSPRESARLQSFFDSFIFQDTKTSQYQQIANAVPPLLSLAIAKEVKEFFKDIDV